MLVLDKQYVQYFYSQGILHAKWIGYANTDEIKEGLEAGLDLVTQKKSRCWLADVVDMSAMDPEFLGWYENDWQPRLIKAGLKRMAFVESKDIFNQALIETGVADVIEKDVIDTRYFNDMESARKWLLEEYILSS